jgi:hypothetical protein
MLSMRQSHGPFLHMDRVISFFESFPDLQTPSDLQHDDDSISLQDTDLNFRAAYTMLDYLDDKLFVPSRPAPPVPKKRTANVSVTWAVPNQSSNAEITALPDPLSSTVPGEAEKSARKARQRFRIKVTTFIAIVLFLVIVVAVTLSVTQRERLSKSQKEHSATAQHSSKHDTANTSKPESEMPASSLASPPMSSTAYISTVVETQTITSGTVTLTRSSDFVTAAITTTTSPEVGFHSTTGSDAGGAPPALSATTLSVSWR